VPIPIYTSNGSAGGAIGSTRVIDFSKPIIGDFPIRVGTTIVPVGTVQIVFMMSASGGGQNKPPKKPRDPYEFESWPEYKGQNGGEPLIVAEESVLSKPKNSTDRGKIERQALGAKTLVELGYKKIRLLGEANQGVGVPDMAILKGIDGNELSPPFYFEFKRLDRPNRIWQTLEKTLSQHSNAIIDASALVEGKVTEADFQAAYADFLEFTVKPYLQNRINDPNSFKSGTVKFIWRDDNGILHQTNRSWP
jgi:hypothetical protein